MKSFLTFHNAAAQSHTSRGERERGSGRECVRWAPILYRQFAAHPYDIPKHLIIKIANILHCSCAFFIKAMPGLSPLLVGHLTVHTSLCFNMALLFNAFIPMKMESEIPNSSSNNNNKKDERNKD